MIDHEFISRLEGGRSLKGYVPNPNGSRSGVTIATGVDLGQMSEHDLSIIPVSQYLKDKLRPYLGKTKLEAVAFLFENPLTLTDGEAQSLDIAIRKEFDKDVTTLWYSASGTPFTNIPEAAQTIIASVAYQYGHLPSRCPKFWRLCISQDWEAVIKELENFGDSYRTRRMKEAAYLRNKLNARHTTG